MATSKDVRQVNLRRTKRGTHRRGRTIGASGRCRKPSCRPPRTHAHPDSPTAPNDVPFMRSTPHAPCPAATSRSITRNPTTSAGGAMADLRSRQPLAAVQPAPPLRPCRRMAPHPRTQPPTHHRTTQRSNHEDRPTKSKGRGMTAAASVDDCRGLGLEKVFLASRRAASCWRTAPRPASGTFRSAGVFFAARPACGRTSEGNGLP